MPPGPSGPPRGTIGPTWARGGGLALVAVCEMREGAPGLRHSEFLRGSNGGNTPSHNLAKLERVRSPLSSCSARVARVPRVARLPRHGDLIVAPRRGASEFWLDQMEVRPRTPAVAYRGVERGYGAACVLARLPGLSPGRGDSAW